MLCKLLLSRTLADEEQLALSDRTQLRFLTRALEDESTRYCLPICRKDREKPDADFPTEHSRFSIVNCVSRRDFVRGLSGYAAWLLTPSSMAMARLIQRGRPNVLETPLGDLGKSWLTPNNSFFVLSRITPDIPAQRLPWQIAVSGLVRDERQIQVRDLLDRSRFEWQEFPACIECAGNGRRFFHPKIDDIPWGHGAIGNALWSGVRLADLLNAVGLAPGARHVAFVGADSSPKRRDDFIKSIPLSKAMEPHTLLALRMNGKPLPVEHGAPVRMIVPGWIGAYNIKWLTHIIVLREPWDGQWMNRAYTVPTQQKISDKNFPQRGWEALTSFPVNSIITEPADGERRPRGVIQARGFAWAGEAEVTRVEISVDGGATWRLATLGRERAKYAWRGWSFTFDAAPGVHTITVRATDTAGTSQPLVQDNWNPGGYCWHAAHAIRIRVV
jgi:sulfite oxidase